jgi:hypothetical protein
MYAQPFRFIILSLLLGLFLTNCGSLVAVEVLPGQPVTPEILGDCFQTAKATAWLDENGNGVQDDGEQPLAGIEFVLEPTVYSRTKSGADGVANIFATTPGGCLEDLQVIAVGFEGYALTTPQTVEYISAESNYLFGFQEK